MTDSTQTTNQAQQSTTNPYAPAQPLINQLLGSYGAQNTGVTSGQSAALGNLQSSANAIPNEGNAATGAVNSLFGATNAPQVGTLNSAYGTLQNNLNPVANGSQLNPWSTPGFSDAINTGITDATNAVKGVYAGSGRDPSGAGSFAQSLGRGITQGISPTIAAQYNTNEQNMLGANSTLFNAGGSTASGISNLNSTALGENAAGITAASALPGVYTAPGTAQLGAANAAYSQPYSNLSQLLQPSTALAGLGGTSSGTGTSTSTLDPSLLSSLTSLLSAGGTGASGLGSLFKLSDMRLKTDIHPVGKLNDGQTVHSFRFKGHPATHVGLLAQEVKKRIPSAVHQHQSGALMVDYAAATAPSAAMAGDDGKVGELAA